MECPSWVTNEQEWTDLCVQIAARSRELLDRRLGVIDAARQLSALGYSVRAERDPDFNTFVAIDCESDHLPIGRVRREWAPDALERKDAEIRVVEERWRDKALN